MGGEPFYRPERKREDRTGEGFHRVLKQSVQVALSLLGIVALCFAGYQVYAHLQEDSLFRVREVEIRGCQKIPEETLRSLARVEGNLNLLSLRLEEVAQRIEAHPWVDGVRVKKIFPDRISIQIEERRPVAILQMEEPFYIDSRGVIFSRVGDRDGYDYPFLTGLNRQDLEREPEMAKSLIEKALECLRAFHRWAIFPLPEISEVRMEKRVGISCVIGVGGIEVRMGWDHYEEKLRRLALIWSDLQRRGIVARAIDCRELKRMVVKKVPPAVEIGRR